MVTGSVGLAVPVLGSAVGGAVSRAGKRKAISAAAKGRLRRRSFERRGRRPTRPSMILGSRSGPTHSAALPMILQAPCRRAG